MTVLVVKASGDDVLYVLHRQPLCLLQPLVSAQYLLSGILCVHSCSQTSGACTAEVPGLRVLLIQLAGDDVLHYVLMFSTVSRSVSASSRFLHSIVLCMHSEALLPASETPCSACWTCRQ